MSPALLDTIRSAFPIFIGIVGLIVVSALVLMAFSAPDRSKKTRSRLSALAPKREEEKTSVVANSVSYLRIIGEWLAKSPLIGIKEKNKMATVLTAAGLRDPKSVAILIACKVGLWLIGAIASGAVCEALDFSLVGESIVVLIAMGVGWKLPDFFVGNYAKSRRRRLASEMPDGLDLMVICVEAGLSLEQALDRVSHEMEMTSAVVSEELGLTVAEMRVSPQLDIPLYNFAKRADVQMIRSMVTTMVQALQYGTPLSQSLRVLAAEMRQHKLIQLEEKAARLPILMTIPLIIFILPCLFIVVGGPAVLNIIDAISGGK